MSKIEIDSDARTAWVESGASGIKSIYDPTNLFHLDQNIPPG